MSFKSPVSELGFDDASVGNGKTLRVQRKGRGKERRREKITTKIFLKMSLLKHMKICYPSLLASTTKKTNKNQQLKYKFAPDVNV